MCTIYNALFFVCLFFLAHENQQFLTHIQWSSLPIKGSKFWPMLGSLSHWAVRVLKCAIPTVTKETWVIHLYGHPRGSMTLNPVAEHLVVELWLPALMTSVCSGRDSNAQPSTCEANAPYIDIIVTLYGTAVRVNSLETYLYIRYWNAKICICPPKESSRDA